MKVVRWHLIFILFLISTSALSQGVDRPKIIQHFSGSAYLTNNGISLVPTFSLGEPAVLFLLSMGGERFSFDPDIRFGLDGKPWTFLLWARYKLFTGDKFRMNPGVHLGMNFRTIEIQNNGAPVEAIILRRYLAVELAPNYFVAKNISIGSYYLYSRGIDAGTVENTHFITLNTNLSRIPITKHFFLRAVPSVYYLYQDGKDGYYLTGTFTLAKQNFPLSISSIINKELRSNIVGSKDLNWNLSLVYSFNKNYISKPPNL